MSKDLITVNPKEFGIEETKAKEISNIFKPMLDKMTELEKEANKIFKTKEINENIIDAAKKLRLQYVKVRTGTAEIHKAQKAFYLAGGRFIDGWKNAQLLASQGVEERLKAIEDHYENIEKQKIIDKQSERSEILRKLGVDTIPDYLGQMQDEVWNNFLKGTEENQKAKKLAEEQAERERIAQQEKAELKTKRSKEVIPFYSFINEDEKQMDLGEITEVEFNNFIESLKQRESEYNQKIEDQRIENDRLKKEAEEKEKAEKAKQALIEKRQKELQPYIVFIRDYNGLISKPEAEYQKEFIDIKKGAEDHWEFERKERLRKQKEDEKAALERKKLEDQLNAKKEAEEKAKKEAEKLAEAPIKKQLSVWVDSFELPELKTDNVKAIEIKEKFESFKKWATEQVNNI